MQVEYIGPHAAVDLALPDRQWVTVARGEAVEVPDALGQQLVAGQPGNWRERRAVSADEQAPSRAPARRAGKDES